MVTLNVNLLKIHTKPNYNAFLEIMLTHSFYPKITLSTRICDTSSTLIDQIYTNTINTQDISGIFTSHISDHQAIFTSTNTGLLKYGERQYIHIETKDDASLNKFINELKNLDIVGKLNREANADPNHNYEILTQVDGGAYSPFRSILLVLTHDYIITCVYGVRTDGQ